MKIQFKIILWSVIFSWLAIGDIVAQTAPSNLVATPKSSSQIDLAWKDNAGNETGFDVQWGENTNYSTGSASITTKNIEAHSVTGLKTSTKYFFRVRAKTATTVSAWVTAEAATLDVTPTAPSALNLSVQNNGTQIAVSWKDNSGNETNFDIEWGQTGNYGSSAGVGANVSSYNITTVPCEAYYVRVKARNSAGSSAWIENKTRTDLTPPAAPSTLAGSVVSSTQINLSWTDNSTNESNFVVQYADNSTYTNATEAVLNANSQSYNLTNLKASTGYYFRVKARNCGGESSWTDSKGATQSPPVTLPSTPANLSASAVSATQIDIRWETGSGGGQPTGFDWQCSTDKTFATVTKSGNTATKDVSVIGLNSNTLYYIRVQAKNSAGSSAWSNVVEATTQSPPVTVPSAPSSLSASAVSSSQINLIWKDNSNNETGFDIERSGDGTTFSALASVDANITTYQSTGLVSNTKYYYRVRSKNSASSSGWSNVTDAITQLPPVTTPSAPASLSASSGSSSQINLSWSDNSNNETGFDIERSGDGSNFSALASVDANITTYQNTGLVSNTKYYYRVRAKNSAGNSGWSNTADATTQQPPVTVPSTPTNLSASTASSSQVNLTWGDVTNETGYDIERSTDGSSFSVLASVDANVTTYANTGLAASTKYWYRVKAKNSAGNSGWSNTADATTQQPPVTVPSTPTNLSASAASSSQINLTWGDVTNETGYDIERSTDGSSFSALASVDANVTTYANTGLAASTKYWYRVKAKNSAGNSGWSNTADATTQQPPVTVPSTPTNLSASAASSSQINLTWGDVINETGYDIERSTDGSSFSVLASVDANVTTYANTGLAASTKYWYRVKAKNSAGNSGWSNTADATTQSPPVTILPKPTNLREKMGNPVINQISIVWDENAQDETGYEVSRATNSTTTWEVLKGDLPAQSKEYVDKAVRTGNKYYYRVRAIRNSSFSEYSDVLSVNAPLVNSVSNPNLEEVVVFPNPATDWFKIKMPIGILQSVRIFSWEGKSLKQWIDPPFAAFDISGLLSGQYVIEVIQDNQKKSFKLIKQ